MDNFKETKIIIKKLWDEDYSRRGAPTTLIEKSNDTWKNIQNKIILGEFSFFDYVQKNDNEKNYLPNFIENHCNQTGGIMYGSQNYVMLKRNHDKNGKSLDSYYLSKWETDTTLADTEFQSFNESIKEATEDEAKDYFSKYIIPFLNKIVSLKTITDADEFLNETKFISKAFVKKIVLLSSLCDYGYDFDKSLPFLSKDENVNALYNNLVNPDLNSASSIGFFQKSKKIFEKTQEILDLKGQNDIKTIWLVSVLLWDYSCSIVNGNSKSLQNVIYYGCPGTGKTYEVKNLVRFLSKDRYTMVQFHPGYTYDDFIEGIKPVGIDNNGNIKFSVINGHFKNLCIKALSDPDHEYYFIADEINRTNLSSLFGECLSLLEINYRFDKNDPSTYVNLRETPLSSLIYELDGAKEKLAFIYDEERKKVLFGIPKNIHFIGTMNDIDKSIDSFDLALRRRFTWIRKEFDKKVLKEQLYSYEELNDYDKLNIYIDDCVKLNAYISDKLGLGKGFEFGHSYFFSNINDFIIKNKSDINRKELFIKRIEPLLEQYLIDIFPNEKERESKIEEAKQRFGIENNDNG